MESKQIALYVKINFTDTEKTTMAQILNSNKWHSRGNDFQGKIMNLKRWFEVVQKKEVKDINVSSMDPETLTYNIIVMCRDSRTGVREDWLTTITAGERALITANNEPIEDFSALTWKKVFFEVPQDRQHDWGNRNGIVVCSACGEIRGFRNAKGYCIATEKALPAPDSGRKDINATIAEEDEDANLLE